MLAELQLGADALSSALSIVSVAMLLLGVLVLCAQLVAERFDRKPTPFDDVDRLDYRS